MTLNQAINNPRITVFEIIPYAHNEKGYLVYTYPKTGDGDSYQDNSNKKRREEYAQRKAKELKHKKPEITPASR